VVVDNKMVDAAVVELLAMALTATREPHVLSGQTLRVVGDRALAVVLMSTRRECDVESV